jgi:hypothetical protein
MISQKADMLRPEEEKKSFCLRKNGAALWRVSISWVL